jgi:hypothetical protein
MIRYITSIWLIFLLGDLNAQLSTPAPPHKGYFWVRDTIRMIDNVPIKIAGHWSKEIVHSQLFKAETIELANGTSAPLKYLKKRKRKVAHLTFEHFGELENVVEIPIEKREKKIEVEEFPVNRSANKLVNYQDYVNRDFASDFFIRSDSFTESPIRAPGSKVSYFLKTLALGELTLSGNSDYLFVIDTLKLNRGSMISTIHGRKKQRAPSLTVISNFIVFDEPVALNLSSLKTYWLRKDKLINDGNFLFAFNKVYQRNKEVDQPFFFRPDSPLDPIGKRLPIDVEETRLLNQNFVMSLEQVLAQINSSSSPSVAQDNLIDQFKSYRSAVQGTMESSILKRFNDVCSKFDEKNFPMYSHRKIAQRIVCVDRHDPTTKYYLLPLQLNLKSINKGSEDIKLGTYSYPSVGQGSQFIIFDTSIPEQGTSTFGEYQIEPGLPRFVLVNNQALIHRGKKIGTINPVTNSVYTIQIDSPEPAITVAEVFPKSGVFQFNIDFISDQSIISQMVTLEFDRSIIRNYDYSNFSVFEPYDNSKERRYISINLNAESFSERPDDEGYFKMVEGLVEVLFEDGHSTTHPFSLSYDRTIFPIPVLFDGKYTFEVKVTVIFSRGRYNLVVKPLTEIFASIEDISS